jgi:hypothetical protein
MFRRVMLKKCWDRGQRGRLYKGTGIIRSRRKGEKRSAAEWTKISGKR